MKNQPIIVSKTRLHRKSAEFWEYGYDSIEPWFHLPNVQYGGNVNELIFENKKFVYPVYTLGHPSNWLMSKNGLLNVLEHNVLQYASKGNVLIYLSQVCEGFSLIGQSDNFWPQADFDFYKVLHKWCDQHAIPYKNLIFHTSNLLEETYYENYCSKYNINGRIKVISQPVFADIIKSNYFDCELEDIMISFQEQYLYKIKNNVKLLSCLNRRDRTHRGALLLFLHYYNLIKDNDISFPPFQKNENENNLLPQFWNDLHPALSEDNLTSLSTILPLIIDSEKFEVNWAGNFLKETYYRTWVSVITETLYQDQSSSVFVSEKIFKPMLALHPFIVVGQVNTLKSIKDLGFKTFDSWWDEGYDTETNPIKRLEQICAVLITLSKYSKKQWLDMYRDMYDVLIHNQKHLLNTEFTKSTSNENYVKEFFKCT